MNIKKDDKVVVLSGKDKGKKGKVLEAMPAAGKVIVEGVNMIKKSLKPSQVNPEGGIVETEAPIDASNVMLYDKKAKQAGRVGYKVNDKGVKVRVFKKSGNEVKEAKK